MSDFDAARARTKRPLPLWCDAFMRDTQHFEADEVGAYMRILMAMWSTPSLTLPDDPRRLARAGGVSTRLWKSRIGGVIEPLLTRCEGGVTQARLCREAEYVERQLVLQSRRRKRSDPEQDPPPESGRDTKSRTYAKPPVRAFDSQYDEDIDANPFTINEQGQSADTTADTTADPSAVDPSQRPNLVGGGGGSARAHAHEDDPPPEPPPDTDPEVLTVLAAAQVDRTRKPMEGWIDHAVISALGRWKAVGLELPEIVQIIETVMAQRTEGTPATPTYFDKPMARAARRKHNPPKLHIAGGRDHEPRRTAADRRQQAADDRWERKLAFLRGLDGEP